MDRILGANTINLGGGRRGFRGKDTVAGIPGTELAAVWHNEVQEELLALIESTGQVPSGVDLEQVLRAIRSQRLNFVAAAQVAGTANDVTLAFTPTFGSLADLVGVPIAHLAEADNTGAMTVKVDALAAVPRTWPDGTPLQPGDVKSGRLIVERYDGSAFRLQSSRSPTEVAADQAKVVPVSHNATWSQSLSDSVQTDITSYSTLDSNLDDATFAGGILTVGPRTAGLWMVVAAGAHPSGNSEFLVQIQNAGTGGTAIAYNSSRTTSGAPFVTATGILRRANGDKIRAQARQISGGPATCTGRISLIRLGA